MKPGHPSLQGFGEPDARWLILFSLKSKPNERRRFLQLGLGATAGIITTGIGCKNASGETAQAADTASNFELPPTSS